MRKRQKKNAETAQKEALKNLKEANRQKKIADQKTSDAEYAKNEALKQKAIAEQKTREAEASLQKMREAEAAKNKIEIAKYLSSAERMIALGKYAIARQILTEALQLDKNNPDVLQKLKAIAGK